MRWIPVSYSFAVVAFVDVEMKMGLMRSSVILTVFFAFKNSVANLKELQQDHLTLTLYVVKAFSFS